MPGNGSRVSRDDALDPLVLALDVGSAASRGDVYDAAGRPVQGGRRKVPHAFRTGADGASEIDPDQVVDELGQIIAGLAVEPLQGRIAGVALDTFASSLIGVDADGRAVTPCYTYADSRCGQQVAAMRRELDEAEVQQRTGCRLPAATSPPGCDGCGRPTRTGSPLLGAGCRWASTPTCACSGRRPPVRPRRPGRVSSTAAPGAGTRGCSPPPGSAPTSCRRCVIRTGR